MPELPRISDKEAVNIFNKLGFYHASRKGSLVIMRKDDRGCAIPLHKNLAIGTLRSAIRQAGITVD